MSWIILLASGVLEAVWATALGASKGFTKLVPSTVFLVALALSMGGLAFAIREIPTGAAYAVWVGVGASLTILWAMITGAETASLRPSGGYGVGVSGSSSTNSSTSSTHRSSSARSTCQAA